MQILATAFLVFGAVELTPERKEMLKNELRGAAAAMLEQEISPQEVAALASSGATGEDGLPIPTKCSPFCNATCCGFTEPIKECNSCTIEYECHPGALCYQEGSKNQKIIVPEHDGDPVCQEWCWDTPNCCAFSNPRDCSGCNSSNGCHPEDRCYKLRDEL
uniref:Uncharacterized protein n=1 Tax=Haptolina ericina TaxID=156174 RepID=A0A7S3B8R9_9EUKA|mmetsp:Transcript_53701/g.120468  ORF Transcript_53701/g.120468 Transcript_53701/m.120468 type:complete len:161 (+) Transcript_53701:26-508(+)